MTGPAPFASTEATKSHHGQASHDSTFGVMDIDTGSSRPIHPPARPATIGSSSLENASTQQTQSSAGSQQPVEGASSSAPTSFALQPPARPDEAKFDAPLLLCKKEYANSQPHATQDLIALYGLSPLMSTVIRKDPDTGEKINKMRRSYENQIKSFGLAGKNKVTKDDEKNKTNESKDFKLNHLTMILPEEEWQASNLMGKELSKGFASGTLAKLEKAMKLDPGSVPKNDEWENILGVDPPKRAPGTAADVKGKSAVVNQAKPARINGHPNGSLAAQPISDAHRPKRAGKKRRYNDESYEGYGEGYDDDGLDDGAFSSDGGSRNGKKKRRKDFNTNGPSLQDRGGGYGVSMVGHVGRGIGAYGGR